MFPMAFRTALHVRVKGRRLTLQNRFVVGVTDHAVDSFGTFRRCVTGTAVVV